MNNCAAIVSSLQLFDSSYSGNGFPVTKVIHKTHVHYNICVENYVNIESGVSSNAISARCDHMNHITVICRQHLGPVSTGR